MLHFCDIYVSNTDKYAIQLFFLVTSDNFYFNFIVNYHIKMLQKCYKNVKKNLVLVPFLKMLDHVNDTLVLQMLQMGHYSISATPHHTARAWLARFLAFEQGPLV